MPRYTPGASKRSNKPKAEPALDSKPFLKRQFSSGVTIHEAEKHSLGGEAIRELWVSYDKIATPYATVEAAFEEAEAIAAERGAPLAVSLPSKAEYERERTLVAEAMRETQGNARVFMNGPDGPARYDLETTARELGLRVVRAEGEPQLEGPSDVNVNGAAIEAKSIMSLSRSEPDDPSTLIGNRWLCRGGGALLIAPTGVGKSTFTMQAGLSWGLGRAFYGMTPRAGMRVLIVQAENDEGDEAEMRDGALAALAPSPEGLALLDERVFVHQETANAGAALVADVLAPLCEAHRPDLIILDPALAYVGGNASAQEVVSEFLRNHLTPLLHEFGCGILIVHHTNKPIREKQKDAFSAGDFAYLGAGSAEWANWARAVLTIGNVGSHDIFELYAAKRGKRLGWKDGEGKARYSRYIAHSGEIDVDGNEVLFWREPTPEEIEALDEEREKQSGSKKGGAQKGYNETALAILKNGGGPMAHGEIKRAMQDRDIPMAGTNRAIRWLRDTCREVDTSSGLYRIVKPASYSLGPKSKTKLNGERASE